MTKHKSLAVKAYAARQAALAATEAAASMLRTFAQTNPDRATRRWTAEQKLRAAVKGAK